MSMRITVAGRTNQEIGNLLEQLITELLGKLGFADFIRNAHKTGTEVDIRAHHRVTRAPLICECKARTAPTGAPSLRLFHSEFMRARRKDKRCHGLFISTSGFTGTAREWYAELDKTTQTELTIVDQAGLLELLVQSQLLLPQEAITALIRERHGLGHPATYLLILSRHGLCWLGEYTRAKQLHVTVLDGQGATLSNWKCREILRLLDQPFSRAKLFGLDVRRKVQLALLAAEGLNSGEIAKQIKESLADVTTALANLQASRIIVPTNKNYRFARDPVSFVNVASEFLRSGDSLIFFRSLYAKEMIRAPGFLTYIDERYKLGLSPTEQHALSRVLSVSPSALAYVLFTDPQRYLNTYNHVTKLQSSEQRERWLEQHAASIPREAFFQAVHDFTSGDATLAGHFGDLGVKRTRIRARIDLVGTRDWPKLSIETESRAAIEKAGGPIQAGALVSFTEPAEFDSWNGLFHLELEEWAEAEAELTKALALVGAKTPRDLHQAILNNLGLVYQRQKRWSEAAAVFQRCIALGDLEWPTPFTNLITCLIESSEMRAACQVFTDALRIFPSLEFDPVIQHYKSRLQAGGAA
jgi:tetratricopeptide (TPR) repeat protein